MQMVLVSFISLTAFGEDDAKVGRKYDLPFVTTCDGKGDMTKRTPYAGTFRKMRDPMVLKIGCKRTFI